MNTTGINGAIPSDTPDMADVSAAASSTTPSAGKTAILVGATGAVGKEVLAHLLSSSHFTHVHAFGRRATGREPHPKLTEHTVDFEKLCSELAADGTSTSEAGSEAAKLRDVKADATIITLGTTRAAAGSAHAFEKIDREYVIAAAKAARVEGQTQNLVYLSSTGATSKAPFLYMKSKGLTEEGLAALSYPSTVLFRPGFLYGAQREKARPMETAYGFFTHNVLSKFSSGAEIPVPLLGKSIVAAAACQGPVSATLKAKGVGSPFNAASSTGQDDGEAVVISNADAVKLGKTEEQ